MRNTDSHLFMDNDDSNGAGLVIDGIETIEFLGEGVSGAVYRARMPGIDEEIALKVMHTEAAKDPHMVSRFMLEAEALAALKHPNILKAHKYGTFLGFHYIAMDFVQGMELATLLEERTKLSTQLALEIALQVAKGLQYGHERGILHRDIKPANIMIDIDGERLKALRIVDFGLVKNEKADANLTAVGMVMGTPQYLSPEMARGLKASAASDLYSLGIVLFEMLAGEPPFDKGSTFTIIEQHINEELPLNNPVFTSVSDDILDLLEQMCHKNPAERINSATLVAQLEKLLSASKS